MFQSQAPTTQEAVWLPVSDGAKESRLSSWSGCPGGEKKQVQEWSSKQNIIKLSIIQKRKCCCVLICCLFCRKVWLQGRHIVKERFELCQVDRRWEMHVRWKNKGTEQCTVYSLLHPSIYRLYQSLPPSIHTLSSSLKLQGTLEGKHVSNWGRNPGRPVFLAQARTANTCYLAHKASSEWQLIRSALQRPPLLLHAPSSHLSSHLIWSISILFSVLFVLLSGSVAQLQSEAVELSPGGPHLRGLTAACIISPFAWILIGPDQRAGGGWR